MFISKNRTTFHLGQKKKLMKHRKVSKYYDTDCLQEFFFLFMFLLIFLSFYVFINSYICQKQSYLCLHFRYLSNNRLKITLKFFYYQI